MTIGQLVNWGIRDWGIGALGDWGIGALRQASTSQQLRSGVPVKFSTSATGSSLSRARPCGIPQIERLIRPVVVLAWPLPLAGRDTPRTSNSDRSLCRQDHRVVPWHPFRCAADPAAGSTPGCRHVRRRELPRGVSGAVEGCLHREALDCVGRSRRSGRLAAAPLPSPGR